MLLSQYNSYHHHVFFTSANSVTSWIYGGVYNVTSYFDLRDINSDLQMRNALLESEVVALKNQLNEAKLKGHYSDSIVFNGNVNGEFKFVMADVINNSISRKFNYITINKGSEDGIEPEMGIVDQNGIVGIVNVVGKHSSRAISMLNGNFKLSCKIKNTDFFGSLVWNGNDPTIAYLVELPHHAVYAKGDTIVTSGFSSTFPQGLIVGTIIGNKKNSKEDLNSLSIKLSTDFSQLSTVRVLKNKNFDEISKLEETDKEDEEE